MSRSTESPASTSREDCIKKRSLSLKKDENKPSKCLKFLDIDNIFKHYTSLSEFCIGGEIEINEKASKIFYEASDGANLCVDVLNISEKDIHTLAKNCSLSPFGLGPQSVVDTNVRQAKELRANDFAFQFNPQMRSNITSQIKKLLGDREFLIQPYKLNIYRKGGHFERHKDTLKSEKMIASLVICLPVAFEGGILTVENEKRQSVNFDWGKSISTSREAYNKIQWACFFCSCDHFISKVTKGNRITISYDIFVDDVKQDISDSHTNTVREEYRGHCKEHLINFIKELDVKKVYGYFPNHVYSFSDTDADENNLEDSLKGNDLLLYHILTQQGWNVILQVYYPDLKLYGPCVEFLTENSGERYLELESTLREEDKKLLNKFSTLKLLNDAESRKQAEIHEYKVAYGYTGNSPIREWKSFYAGTIMVIRHQTNTEVKEKDSN